VFKRVLDINFEEGIPIEKPFLNPNLKDHIFEIGDGGPFALG
jgi:hypothetical protein